MCRNNLLGVSGDGENRPNPHLYHLNICLKKAMSDKCDLALLMNLIRKRVNYQYEAALLINLSIEPLQWVSNRVIWTYETSYEVKLMASGFELTLLGTFSNHTQS